MQTDRECVVSKRFAVAILGAVGAALIALVAFTFSSSTTPAPAHSTPARTASVAGAQVATTLTQPATATKLGSATRRSLAAIRTSRGPGRGAGTVRTARSRVRSAHTRPGVHPSAQLTPFADGIGRSFVAAVTSSFRVEMAASRSRSDSAPIKY